MNIQAEDDKFLREASYNVTLCRPPTFDGHEETGRGIVVASFRLASVLTSIVRRHRKDDQSSVGEHFLPMV